MTDQDDIIATAHALADTARRVTLSYFRRADLTADNKSASAFDPVTVADREAERQMREILSARRPNDAVLGEEWGNSAGTSGMTWVLDPVDGTRAFLCGAPTWGVLIAVSNENGPQYGIIDQPYTGERFEGGFGLSRMSQADRTTPLKTRAPRPLEQALLMSTFPEIGTADELRAFRAVANRVRLVRYGMDCYAYALLAAGQIDLVIEAGLQPYDVQAPIAVIRAAGGVVTDWQGNDAAQGGQILAAANPEVHAAAMALLNS
ncbi:inositol monophosphatase family protein [Falsirhodobacter sp. alg1]|uniref:inositol monophosphatase family protein n=1 Tax=Falsirhodobacter sp. alg1 TaxID=1472418 RepID=UPI0005EE5E2D|nr:inositol monophosphatase family protein [Falsirhodobacter sp. alg1]